jgi:hypothetical protein
VTPERWQRVKEVLEGAWERGPRERDGFLDEACAGDAELRSRVEALLASDVNAGEFMAATAMDAAPHAPHGGADRGDAAGTAGPVDIGRQTAVDKSAAQFARGT